MEKAEVCRYLFSLGISPKHKGFSYICDILLEMLRCGALCEAGPARAAVCRARGADTRSAERCMRYAVCCAWYLRRGAIRTVFAGSETGCPPALGEFFCVTAWQLDEGRGPTAGALSPAPVNNIVKK